MMSPLSSCSESISSESDNRQRFVIEVTGSTHTALRTSSSERQLNLLTGSTHSETYMKDSLPVASPKTSKNVREKLLMDENFKVQVDRTLKTMNSL